MTTTKMLGTMKIVLAIASTICTDGHGLHVTPVQQVLNMLDKMVGQGKTLMEDEQKVYLEYKTWVHDQTAQLNFEIKTAEEDIDKLVATIEKQESLAQQFGQKVKELESDISRFTSEKQDATETRKGEHEQYLKTSEDYGESVDALDRAIQTLKSQQYSRPEAEQLLQRMSSTVRGMPRVLAAFLQQQDDGTGAPAVAAYDFQSGGIVQLLEELLVKFRRELSETEEIESNSAHAYDLLELHLSNAISYAMRRRAESASAKGQATGKSVAAKTELSATKKELAEDKKLLSDMTATFHVKTATFESNQQVRSEELEAISKAIEIISSPDVAESYSRHVNLAQLKGNRVMLLQTKRMKARTGIQATVATFLQQRARELSSRDLAYLANKVAGSPFTKVISMIEDLLSKLKEEAASEAEHKEWCDKELKENKLKREEKTSEVEKLQAEFMELGSKIASLGEKIEVLLEEQQELTKAMSEATSQRQNDKATNEKAISDAKAGAEAVKNAVAVMKEFYASQGGAFLQQAPEMAAYQGMQGENKGVVGMLEVIASDFVRLEAETSANEEQAASEYKEFMEEATANSEAKHKKEVQLKLEKDQTEFEQSQTKKDLEAETVQLAKADEYYESLKPTCLTIHVSFEERAARRQEEIEALKEAYSVLDGKQV